MRMADEAVSGEVVEEVAESLGTAEETTAEVAGTLEATGDNMEELDYEASEEPQEEEGKEKQEEEQVMDVAEELEAGSDAPEGGDEEKVEASEGGVEGEAGENGVDSKETADSGGAGKKPSESKTSEEGRGDKASTVCKPCNLQFENQRWLETHTKSGDHSHVVKGFKPSSGRYYCYLCWLGFQHSHMLLSHIKRSDHLTRARRKGVCGTLASGPEKDDREGSRSSSGRGEARGRGGRSRSPLRVRLGDYYELSSVGDCDTRGVRLRRIEGSRGKESLKKIASDKCDIEGKSGTALKESVVENGKNDTAKEEVEKEVSEAVEEKVEKLEQPVSGENDHNGDEVKEAMEETDSISEAKELLSSETPAAVATES